jgi:hypothetical protein
MEISENQKLMDVIEGIMSGPEVPKAEVACR